MPECEPKEAETVALIFHGYSEGHIVGVTLP